GRHPTAADTVEASYSGYLVNGTLVDRASTDLPATIPVSTALRGLSEALQLMQVGDHWEIVQHSAIASAHSLSRGCRFGIRNNRRRHAGFPQNKTRGNRTSHLPDYHSHRRANDTVQRIMPAKLNGPDPDQHGKNRHGAAHPSGDLIGAQRHQ